MAPQRPPINYQHSLPVECARHARDRSQFRSFDQVGRDRFARSNHFKKRLLERGLTEPDLLNAIARLIRIVEFPGSQPWATCWRVIGPDLDGQRIGVGVKLYLDDDEEWALCITIIDNVE